jgi:hypothetical protein
VEEDMTGEMNLDIDISIKNDDRLQSILEVIAQIQRKLVTLGEDSVLTFLSALEAQISGYLTSSQGQVLNLDHFAPTSLVYKLLETFLKDSKVNFTQTLLQRMDKLLGLTF